MTEEENQVYQIRTVRVNRKITETDQNFEDSVRECGEFEPEIHTYNEYRKNVSFVTFKSTRGARNALKRKLCASADEWLEPEFIGRHLRSKWPNIDSVCEVDYMSGLNDKCLIDIFSYLDIDDLQNLSKVNQLFHRIVTNFMIGKTNVELSVGEDSKNVDNFLKSFGRFVTKLKFYNSELRCCKDIFLLIPKYCVSENLRCLDLSKICTNNFPIEAYRNSKIFSELRVLKILASTNTILMEEIVKLCSSLKTLHVRSVDDIDGEISGSFLIHLPVDVERVTIKAFCEDKFFHLFIERTVRLQQLSCHIRTTAIIAKIVECQPQLEELVFQCLGNKSQEFTIDKHALSIKNMKQLKSFELEYPWTKDVEMINVISEMYTVQDLIINTEGNDEASFLTAIKKIEDFKKLAIEFLSQ